jgi:16S rRNA (adenine1518-N6/adenine1519-N6)-dimethyltransferase
MKQVRPKKNLGQHFLTDLNIASAIADTVDAYPDIPVLEVGPGMGVLTQFLMQKPRPLSVVEIDRESVEYLKGTLFRGNEGTEARGRENSTEIQDIKVISRTPVPPYPRTPELIEGDFLRMDLHQLFDGKPFVLTGNYPYDISSQIFFKVIDNKDLIPCCTGMIQREVAQRMEAKPGTKAYGILSVLIQAWYDVEYLFTVDENVFDPPPKVKSAVIRMTRNKVQDLGCDEKLFRRVVKTVFNQRRKMLRVSLRQLFTKDTMPDSSFFGQDIMTMRPEQLTIPQFVELTNSVKLTVEKQEARSKRQENSTII